MKSRKIISILVVLALVLSFTSINGDKYCFASNTASAGISVSGSTTVGSTITVNCTFSGNTFGSADGVLVYDSETLEFISCTSGSQAGGGGGSVKFTLLTAEGVSSMTCSLSFNVIKAGSCTLSLYATSMYSLDETELSCSDASKTISLKDDTPAASTNADLSSLKVSSGSLSPGFSAGTTSYTVSVSNSVDTCTISATPADSKASVSVSGSSSLSVGDNVRTVVVTAESGATKKYTVTITRAKAPSGSSGSGSGSGSSSGSTEGDDKEDETDKPEEEEKPKDIEVEVDGTKYIVVENLVGTNLPDGYKLEACKYADKEIPVIVDSTGKYKLANLRKSDSTKGEWFFFDEEKLTFKAKKSLSFDELTAYGKLVSDAVEKTGKENAQRLETELKKTQDDLATANRNKTNLLYGVGGLIVLELLLALVIGIIRKQKKKRNASNEEDDTLDEENDNLNEENNALNDDTNA